MSEDTQNLEWNQAEMLSLEQVAQVGARQMLALAVHAEIQSYLASFCGPPGGGAQWLSSPPDDYRVPRSGGRVGAAHPVPRGRG